MIHTSQIRKSLFLIIAFAVFSLNSYAQKPQREPGKEFKSWEEVEAIVGKSKPRDKLKRYEDVINKSFKSQFGLFGIHRGKDTIYMEVPDSILHRDIMVINRINKISGGYGVYPGEELGEKTIQFEKGIDSTIRIRYDLVISNADSTNEIYKAVINSNLNPVAVSFPIVAFGKDSKSYVIDVSKFFKEKNFVNNIDPANALAKKVNVASMKDFIVESVHTYPINVEITITKNLDPQPGAKSEQPVSIESHTSFIELPKIPLQRRNFDPRVGYFADYLNSYSDDQQKAEQQQFILRWRLEPRDSDIEKWKKGELVEPKKPIVIYIDPATPKQWRPYLIQGINDWQKAFEQAGFKNAIAGKEWPESDTTMHMDDARYSMVSYFPSEVANAYGPQIHDPRSGEIIQTHIGWYHNVMSLLHNWYIIQAGAVDPKARKAKFDTELMGELIRFVSSHEIGHTLGLRHNFGSSSQTPVDSLRSKHYLEKHGHTASIMDYARFNYVAQPEDHLPEADLFPRIGEYDKWAIEWGYKNSNALNEIEDKKIVTRWIENRIPKNKLLWFGDGETRKFDPRCQTEDLGDDAVKASTYGIKNLKRILPFLPKWSEEEDGVNKNLDETYKALTDQYFKYMNHVLKNVGGIYYNIKGDDEKGPAITVEPLAKQRAVINFFNTQLFTTPYWILNKDILDRVTLPSEPNFVEDLQQKVLNSLLDISRINSLLANMKSFGDKAYPVNEYLGSIHREVWKELRSKGPVRINSYRRNLQKTYWGAVFAILSARDVKSSETDASSLFKADVLLLQSQIKQAMERVHDPMTLYHLKDMQSRIKSAMESKMPI